ncbi:MAG: thiamine pyrophosphate-dependent enzyme [Actinomycetota bacterium]|nr:transketolase [Actinomycetota bacterium]
MSKTITPNLTTPDARLVLSADEIVADYRMAYRSRIASLIGRKEFRAGRVKFGIFGDGKEVAQLAMARAFRPGDWRSGYYRDQTFMLAAGMLTMAEYFAQLYADSDPSHDPASAGRQMGSHFATRFLDEGGAFIDQVTKKNTSADMSPTAGQMARLLGLAYASKLYRNNEGLKALSKGFSVNGNEVAFGTIGNASTSEGIFWETVNAAGVLQVPMLLSIWDDGYGISVPNELQTVKSSISRSLEGMRWESGSGLDIYTVRGWDYVALVDTYALAADRVRREHIPALIHVTEMTQPQGHSTSGSHERYKPQERLQWEDDHDCIAKMREWLLSSQITTVEALAELEAQDKQSIEQARKDAWDAYIDPMKQEVASALSLIEQARSATGNASLDPAIKMLAEPMEVNRKLVAIALTEALIASSDADDPAVEQIRSFLTTYEAEQQHRYRSHLYSTSTESPLEVEEKKPAYSDESELVDGSVVLVRCFDHNFKKDARLFVVGEDVGRLGDVNKVFDGLNAKYGDMRLTDTGIREATILGQGIGAAMRGLRPIVDIQYLDYLIYALQGLSDDVATIRYRTAGGQKAPVIVRTKGHRLQGIWHTGSPMSMILGACPGIYLCVPRDMTRAAGMYNTLLQGDDPAIVIEVLSGYYIKERVPDNVGSFTVPLGQPEVLREGKDLTIVTYAACCKVASEAAEVLETLDIDVEIIDVQTLNPFDLDSLIGDSLSKTNAVLFLDEDIPGGASAFMMQKVLEEQQAWHQLDCEPRTLTATDNRSPYATDGNYFTKPNREQVIVTAYDMMRERSPRRYRKIF